MKTSKLSIFNAAGSVRGAHPGDNGASSPTRSPDTDADWNPFDGTECMNGGDTVNNRGRVRAVSAGCRPQTLFAHGNQPIYPSRPCEKHERTDPDCPDCRFEDEPRDLPMFRIKEGI